MSSEPLGLTGLIWMMLGLKCATVLSPFALGLLRLGSSMSSELLGRCIRLFELTWLVGSVLQSEPVVDILLMKVLALVMRATVVDLNILLLCYL